MKKTLCLICIGLWAITAKTQTTNKITSVLGQTYTFTNLSAIEAKSVSTTWLEIWQDQLENQTSIVMSGTFGWQSVFSWTRKAEKKGFQFNLSYTDSGKNGLQRSFLNSVRESAVRIPGFFESGDWIENGVIGFFARTSEESVHTTGLTPEASQMTFWQEILANNGNYYGARLSHVYLGTPFGHWSDGQPIGTAFARLHYDPILLHSSVDEQISLFLPLSFNLTLGSSYELIDLRSDMNGLKWSATLTHTFGKNWYEAIAFANISTNERETLATAGVNYSF